MKKKLAKKLARELLVKDVVRALCELPVSKVDEILDKFDREVGFADDEPKDPQPQPLRRHQALATPTGPVAPGNEPDAASRPAPDSSPQPSISSLSIPPLSTPPEANLGPWVKPEEIVGNGIYLAYLDEREHDYMRGFLILVRCLRYSDGTRDWYDYAEGVEIIPPSLVRRNKITMPIHQNT